MKNLMRTETEDGFGLKNLQNVILNIAQYVDSLCQEYDINYRLMGGSALGAKRHQGFIPWDDDLDIFMTPSEYERFKDIFLKVGDKEKYTLQELGASKGKVTTAKIRLNNSYYEEDVLKGWKMHHGVFIDIFILHTCPDSKIAQLWQYFWAKYLVVKGVSNKPQYARRNGVAGLIVNMFRILPKRFLVDYALTQVYHWRSEKTEYYCNFLGKALFKNGKYKHNDFATSKRMPFETIELNVPYGLERFLTDRFGNYMQIPSMERIKYEQHASTWDLGDYDYSDRSDEKFLL